MMMIVYERAYVHVWISSYLCLECVRCMLTCKGRTQAHALTCLTLWLAFVCGCTLRATLIHHGTPAKENARDAQSIVNHT
jgi:hypothetical protein